MFFEDARYGNLRTAASTGACLQTTRSHLDCLLQKNIRSRSRETKKTRHSSQTSRLVVWASHGGRVSATGM